jgi:Holliday junction DNA helicase RuvA
MIGRIRGLLIEKKPPQLMLEVQGVGYQIFAPLSTFMRLPALYEEVILYTEFIVREDAQLLYGFLSEADKALFQKIIKVNGIGPKLGLTILSGMEPQTFAKTIEEGDIDTLVKLPGVGKKTAERMLVELRGKLNLEISDLSKYTPKTPEGSEQRAEVIAALESLGFKSKEAEKATHRVWDFTKTTEELIKLALQGA